MPNQPINPNDAMISMLQTVPGPGQEGLPMSAKEAAPPRSFSTLPPAVRQVQMSVMDLMAMAGGGGMVVPQTTAKTAQTEQTQKVAPAAAPVPYQKYLDQGLTEEQAIAMHKLDTGLHSNKPAPRPQAPSAPPVDRSNPNNPIDNPLNNVNTLMDLMSEGGRSE